MKNKRLKGFLLAALALAGAGFLAAGQRSDRVGYKDTIVVAVGETRDNVVSFGGDIIVDGKVRKTVFALGGSITISGEVGDAVVGLGSVITIKSTAVIKGDLVGLGGSVLKEPGFKVEGDTVYFKSSELTAKIFKEGLKGVFSVSFWPIILVFKLVNLFIWLLVGIVMAVLFPRQITFAASELRRNFWPTFGTGLLALVCFTIFVIFAAVLCLILIGIPIVLSLAVAGLIVKAFGRVVILFLFGESLAAAFHKRQISPIAAVLLGLLVFGFIGFIPVLGFFFSFLMGIMGWGIALRTKFGTVDNWFRRGPRLFVPAPPAPPAPPVPPAA
jgi:hypothetical protein